MGILDKIVEAKSQRLASAMQRHPLSELRTRLSGAEPPRDFAGALTRPGNEGIRLIAEVKRASPSMGIIREDFDPEAIARAYRPRVDAISVLTEEDYFRGHLSYLSVAREASGKPVLRKDFLFHEYQLVEARAFGADAVLLIDAILDGSQPAEYLHLARELGLAVLYEVHTARELERALTIEVPVIGINNRDFTTMTVDLNTTLELLEEIPPGKTVVSESGISSREHIRTVDEAGVDAVLIGTTFMKSADIAVKMDELFGKNSPGGHSPSP
jgi:indole-3-glycerol phosphate synthase